MIESPVAVLAVLLGVLGALFAGARHPIGRAVFKRVPLLVFAYFLPTLLSNTGVIPLKSPLYTFIKATLLPASLVLLTLSVDLKAVARLGRPALIMFATGTASIVLGGAIAYGALGWMVPDGALAEEAWKGLAALSGSWIGGTANMAAIGESVGLDMDMPIYGIIIVVDVVVANVWMAALLYFAGNSERIDRAMGADRTAIDDVRDRIESFRATVARPTTLADLLVITALAIGVAVMATELAGFLPDLGSVVRGFTWVVLIATTVGVAMSLSPLRRLEGVGAGAVGSLFLYLLVASIGAKAKFTAALDAPALLAIGALWMVIHAGCMLLVWRIVRVPIFFLAVGSQANVGGAASAPIVAAAFHPALAPVGVLLAVCGYVLGTYAALGCAALLHLIHGAL